MVSLIETTVYTLHSAMCECHMYICSCKYIVIFCNRLTSREYLEVRPLPTTPSLYLSFPSEFLGDKRTAYGQDLSLNLSVHAQALVNGGNEVPQCRLTLEIESGFSLRTKHKLRTALPSIGEDPVLILVRQ